MEAESGVATESDKHVITEKVHVGESDVDVKKEEKNLNKNGQSSGNGVHEITKLDGKTLNVCGPEAEVSVNVKSKSFTDSKASKGGNQKNNKVVKSRDSVKGSTSSARGIARPSLSQSLSFPAKGLHSDAMRKSIDVYPAKSARKIGSIVKEKVSSTSHPSINVKEVKNVVNLKSESAKGSVAAKRRVTLASSPSLHKSMSGKFLSANGTSTNATNEVSIEQVSKPISIPPLREDEDAHSTHSSIATSGGTRRSTLSGFSSRLQERAEKRKEFFSKMEEQIQAREVERTNLQEKSKENQEAEIKQFRRTLTFKATPMPSFYKEPPPKPELKKVPTTRAKSPKLGRHKISTSVSNTLSGAGVSSLSPRVIKENQGKSSSALPANSNKSNATLKKPVKTAESKPQSRALPANTKVKPAEAKSHNENTHAEKMTEISNQASSDPQVEGQIDIKFIESSAEENRATSTPSEPVIMMPAKVIVAS